VKTLRLGSRKSALAQTQAALIAKEIQRQFPDTKVETVLITTSGDENPHPASPPSPYDRERVGVRVGGLKALFTKEIEEALLQRKIDLAVHSLKDMAAELPPGLILGAVPEREDARDAWISKNNTPFAKLALGARIGTGSSRRNAQLKFARPDLEIAPMRGNVDTRLKKLRENDWDGIILAVAGLKRLSREREITEILSPELLLPAVGQGALVIEVREKDTEIAPILKALDHTLSHQAALAERAFLKGLGGSCQTPIAGHAIHKDGQLILTGLVLSRDGKEMLKDSEEGRPFDAAGVGERLAAKLLEQGAAKLLS
jgi:hydroxymethylbilane synthase